MSNPYHGGSRRPEECYSNVVNVRVAVELDRVENSHGSASVYVVTGCSGDNEERRPLGQSVDGRFSESGERSLQSFSKGLCRHLPANTAASAERPSDIAGDRRVQRGNCSRDGDGTLSAQANNKMEKRTTCITR